MWEKQDGSAGPVAGPVGVMLGNVHPYQGNVPVSALGKPVTTGTPGKMAFDAALAAGTVAPTSRVSRYGAKGVNTALQLRSFRANGVVLIGAVKG